MDAVKPWVLIIEDDTEFANALSDALNSTYRTIKTNKASDAMVKLRNQKFAVVLVDMRLESGDGEQVISGIRNSKDPNVDTPVIVISAYLDAPLVKRIATQIQGVLVKPFDSSALKDKLKTVMAAAMASGKRAA